MSGTIFNVNGANWVLDRVEVEMGQADAAPRPYSRATPSLARFRTRRIGKTYASTCASTTVRSSLPAAFQRVPIDVEYLYRARVVQARNLGDDMNVSSSVRLDILAGAA